MTQTQFQRRPLNRTQRDDRLWVEPAAFQEILRSLELGFNTLVSAGPGGGVTTTLNRVAGEIEDKGGPVVRVFAGDAQTVTELLDKITDGLGHAETAPSLRAALANLRSAAEGRPGTLIVVDAVSGRAGHDLFGRMRDELWEMDVRWLVGARSDDVAMLLRPPADAFFETTVLLDALSADQLVELLARRDPADEFDPELRRQIATASDGDPSLALAAARHILLIGDPMQAVYRDPVVDVRQRLGEPAARLYADLLRHGPSGPSDPALRARLGWSRPRAYQVFQQLTEAGMVRVTSERSGAAGRPRKLYEAAPLP